MNFLFLLIVKGLSANIERLVSISDLFGFKVGSEDLMVSHLQYINDTFISGDTSRVLSWPQV